MLHLHVIGQIHTTLKYVAALFYLIDVEIEFKENIYHEIVFTI